MSDNKDQSEDIDNIEDIIADRKNILKTYDISIKILLWTLLVFMIIYFMVNLKTTLKLKGIPFVFPILVSTMVLVFYYN